MNGVALPLILHTTSPSNPHSTAVKEYPCRSNGAPAKLVKCETIDLMVPANAEVVLECELMATEGWVHDEAPFGEFTGMYGGGLKHNLRAVVKAITHRKTASSSTRRSGAGILWYTDNMLQLPAMEADLFGALKDSALDVLEVREDPAGLSNAYAKIRKQGAGDAKQVLSVMLTRRLRNVIGLITPIDHRTTCQFPSALQAVS